MSNSSPSKVCLLFAEKGDLGANTTRSTCFFVPARASVQELAAILEASEQPHRAAGGCSATASGVSPLARWVPRNGGTPTERASARSGAPQRPRTDTPRARAGGYAAPTHPQGGSLDEHLDVFSSISRRSVAWWLV